jgi:outer membrane receptor protein involved in Fe transport
VTAAVGLARFWQTSMSISQSLVGAGQRRWGSRGWYRCVVGTVVVAVAPAVALAAPIGAQAAATLGDDGAATPPPRLEKAIDETIVVTAGRVEQRIQDVPVHVSVLVAEDLERSATQATDDLLRQLPAFNLQRPDSSRIANQSSQSVVYRGLGGNSASRALVLVDGVPLNEPFAGWLSWSRVPVQAIERIEVVPGGGASAWGNQALGGVIHIFTRRPQPKSLDLQGRYGSRSTYDVGALGSHVAGPVAVSAYTNLFDTDGYSNIPREIQGPGDRPNTSRSFVADGRVQLSRDPGRRFTLHGSFLDDDRNGDTDLTEEALELVSARAATDLAGSGDGFWQLNAFALLREASNYRGDLDDARAVALPRRNQFDNPSDSLGASAGWSRAIRDDRHLLSAGADLQWTRSEVNEDTSFDATFDGGGFTERFRSGGDQLLGGLYVQDSANFGSRLRLVVGSRVDQWRTSEGEFYGESLRTGTVLFDDQLQSRSKLVWSPNAGVRYSLGDRLGLRGSLFRSFRAPSPNELFKSSPSSRSYLAANNDLDPERITLGAEAGFDFVPGSLFLLRGTAFWNEVEDLVTDVTVGVAGNAPEVIEPCGLLRARGTCRQRRNIDLTRNRGVELLLESRPADGWRFSAAWTYVDSKIVDSPQEPALEGKWLRRVPEHQGTFQVSWEDARFLGVSMQARYQGERFEEDLNTLEIADALVVDLHLSRQIAPALGVFVAVENLFDTEVAVGRDEDFTELGQFRYVHAGLRYRWRGR